MELNRWLRLIAGFFVLLSLVLGYFVSPYFYLFTAFVGLNQLQSAFTGWCPMMTFLRLLGVRSCEDRTSGEPGARRTGKSKPQTDRGPHPPLTTHIP